MHIEFNQVRRIPMSFAQHAAPVAGRTAGRAAGGDTVDFSDEAMRLDAEDARLTTKKMKTEALRDFIKGIDFTRVTPAVLHELGMRLGRSGEVSLEQAGTYFAVENNIEPPMDRSKEINLMDHLKMMYGVVRQAAKTDPTMDFALRHARDRLETLQAIRSFAASNKPHIFDSPTCSQPMTLKWFRTQSKNTVFASKRRSKLRNR